MNQAFIREADDQWLSDVGPSLNALIHFLTRANNGIRVYEKSNFSENKQAGGSSDAQWIFVLKR